MRDLGVVPGGLLKVAVMELGVRNQWSVQWLQYGHRMAAVSSSPVSFGSIDLSQISWVGDLFTTGIYLSLMSLF